MMRAPAFWYRPASVRATLLSPLGKLYAFGTKRRLAAGRREVIGVPVICVGNINVGGTGKTPTAIGLIEYLTAMGHQPHVVTRGYGGSLEGPVQVDLTQHNADQTGDEPLLIAAFAPVWVAKDRATGARAAKQAGASVIVLDDGFQNADLAYDLAIVVVDGARGFGNGRVMPAGPLREPVGVGLERADAVLSIGPNSAQKRFRQNANLPQSVAHLTGQLEPVETGMDWPNSRIFAFAGIGDPEKFFATLRGLGAQLVGTRPLDDHQPIERSLLTRLLHEAQALNAQLVTTEKDAVRIPAEMRHEVLSLPVRLKFNEPESLQAVLATSV